MDNSVATKDEVSDLATIVSNKADLARQNKIQQSVVDLMQQLAGLSGGFDSVIKDFTKLDEEVKREFRGVRSEVRESKMEVIKDSTLKLERVTELITFCQNLDIKVVDGFSQLNQRLKKYVRETDLA